MGLLHRIFNTETKSYDQAAWEALIDQGSRTASKILVTPTTALDCPPVAAAVRIRVETIGSLGLFLYQRGAGNERSRASDHPLYRLLHDRPNPWTSAAEFIMQLETDVLCEGAGFAYASRNGDRIVELVRLDPLAVAVKSDPRTLEPFYEVTLSSGGTKRYDWRDVLHVPGSINFANRADARPFSAIRKARQAIGLAIALEAHGARIMGNAARPGGALISPKRLDDTALKRLTTSWRGAHSGDNAGGTAVLEDGVKFEPLAFTSVDIEFSAMRMFQAIEIGRCLGVPPPLMYELGRATFANSEQLGQQFLTYTLLGRTKLWQGAINRLLTPEEQETYFAEFEIDSLVKADLAARYEAFTRSAGGPWMTPDEVRQLSNMPPIEGGDKLRPPPNATGVDANPKAEAK